MSAVIASQQKQTQAGMYDDELTTYLRLTPEFGGTRFGPFEGLEVRLGSDTDRCDIVLRSDLGVLPEHVKLFRQGSDNLILAPSERTAGVFLFRMNAGRPSQVTSPTAVRPGDAFTLVTPGGPRFIVELDELPPEVQAERAKKKGSKTGKGRLTGDAMAGEAKRQAFTTLLVTGPAQIAQRAVTFVKSGAIFMPRNIILGLGICGGWLFGGVTMCNSKKVQTELNVTNERVENCDKELAFADNLNKNSSDYSFEQLIANVTGSGLLGQALEEDDALRAMVKKKAKTSFANAKRFAWLTKRSGAAAAQFADWRERISGEDSLDDDTRRLLVWLAGTPAKRNSDFADLTDSEGDDVCARGPIRLTYRQAVSLGMDTQADALVTKDYQGVAEDKMEREERLGVTANAAGKELPEESFTTDVDPISQGKAGCIYIDGSDDRTRMSTIVSNLSRHLGESPDDLPIVGDSRTSVTRLAKFWASDMVRVDYREADSAIDFSDSQVGAVLDGYDRRGQWVLEKVADTIARSVVVPCLAVLRNDAEDLKPTFGDALPSPVSCLVLEWKLRNQR